MTTEPSPGQDAPQEDAGWAFRPRRAADAQPDRESHAEAPKAPPPGATAVLDPAAGPVLVPSPDPVAAQSPPGRKGRRAGRIALALTVLAAAGAAAVLLKRADGTPVASKQLTQAWQVPAPTAGDELIGSWLTGKLLVRASTGGGVTAYNLTDGNEVWQAAPTAKQGTVPCAMSPTFTTHGIGTVAFGPGGNSCTSLAGIDTATGKIVWTVPLVDSAHPTAMAAETYVRGDVATVVSENFLGGLDVRTGHRIWGFTAPGSHCNAYDRGADGVVLVDAYCSDAGGKYTFTAFDGRTGKVLWTKSRSSHTGVPYILSGSPLIASIHTPIEDSVRVFAPSGRNRKLAVGNTELSPGNDSPADHSARLVGTVLVTPAQTAAGSEIDGYDTTTGAKLWRYRSAALATATAGDDRVYAITTAGPPQLVRLDPRTGHATPVARLPVGSGHKTFTTGTVYVTRSGQVLELNALGTSGGVQLYR